MLLILFYRTKDNKWVYCAMRIVIAAVLEKALSLGIDVCQIIHKVLLNIYINLGKSTVTNLISS